MTLHIDEEAERTLACMIVDLRSTRKHAGLSQNELAARLPVRARAISEWETGLVEPTLHHLLQWSRELGRRLVIIGSEGQVLGGPLRPRAGESWEAFDRWRLAVPLRNRRLSLRLTQGELGLLVGVSRDSIQRWELARVPPRPISVIVWAEKLGHSLALQPVDAPEEQLAPALTVLTRQ